MISAETNPIVDSLRGAHADAIRESALKVLREFIDEQRAMLTRLAEEADGADSSSLLDHAGVADKRTQLRQTMAKLNEIAA